MKIQHVLDSIIRDDTKIECVNLSLLIEYKSCNVYLKHKQLHVKVK